MVSKAVRDLPAKSRIDPEAHGQDEILRAEAAGATKGSNIKTSKTGGRPEAQRLSGSVDFAERKLQGHRLQRAKFIRQYAGSNYGTQVVEQRDPLNLLYSMVSSLAPSLAIEPKASIKTVQGNKAFGETFRLAINDEIKSITLAETMKEVIVDSLFSLAIMKTGLKASPGFTDDGDLEKDAGNIFSGHVSFADYIIDMTVKHRSHMQFEGNRFSLSADVALASGMFDENIINQLVANTSTRYEQDVATIDSTQQERHNGDNEFIRRMRLVDLFLPDKQMVVTIPGDVRNYDLGYLAQVKWEGDPSGPYDVFGYSPVPDNILPVAVISAIYDLYEFCNIQGRKITRQAKRQKTLGTYQKGIEEDAQAVRDANDGQMVGLSDPGSVNEVSFGGADENGYKTLAWAQDLMNHIAGNPDVIGGLVADSNTLGQDQLMAGNAAGRIDDWRESLRTATESVVKKLAGYVWSDPNKRRVLELKLEGPGDITVERIWDPTQREGDFYDYTVGVSANNRPVMSPDQKYIRKERYLGLLSTPGMVAAAAAQGMTLDVRAIARTMARDLGIEDTADDMFVAVTEVPNVQQTQGRNPMAGGGGSDRTTRNPGRGPQTRGSGQDTSQSPTKQAQTAISGSGE